MAKKSISKTVNRAIGISIMTSITHAPSGHGGSVFSSGFALPPIPSMAMQNLHDGQHHATLYLAGATHLRDFCQVLGVTAFKIGITGNRDAQARIADLRRKSYGSLLLPLGNNIDGISPSITPAITLALAHEWFLMPLSGEWLGDTIMPDGVTLNGNTLGITVPQRITTEAVDKAVHALLSPRSLQAYLATPEGRARMIAAGRDPESWLHTSYSLMTEKQRISPVAEIYLFRPRRELPELVMALGALLKRLRNRPN
jgi:hypothetical protein